MDPVLRTVTDLRRLRSEVDNPFDREKVVEYFCKLADEMGFKAVKNLRWSGVRLDCGWKDGQDLFLAMNVEYGSEREILGAMAEIMVASPEVGVLVTASNPLKPITWILDAAKRLGPSFDLAILDVGRGRFEILRGEK